MNCKNHPDKTAAGKCSECGEDFCQECLSRFKERDYCVACLKGEATLASARLGGGTDELARMRRTLIGCSVVLLALVAIPMFLLIYPMFKLGDIGRCRANLKTIYEEALVVYAEKSDGWFPPENNDLKPLFEKNLVKNAELFRCPGARSIFGESGGVGVRAGSGAVFPPGSSYLYQGGLHRPERKDPSRPLLWDRSSRNHRGKGMNVLRTDGSVKFETKRLSRFRLRKIGTEE